MIRSCSSAKITGIFFNVCISFFSRSNSPPSISNLSIPISSLFPNKSFSLKAGVLCRGRAFGLSSGLETTVKPHSLLPLLYKVLVFWEPPINAPYTILILVTPSKFFFKIDKLHWDGSITIIFALGNNCFNAIVDVPM